MTLESLVNKEGTAALRCKQVSDNPSFGNKFKSAIVKFLLPPLTFASVAGGTYATINTVADARYVVSYPSGIEQVQPLKYRADIEDAMDVVKVRKPELYRFIKEKGIPVQVGLQSRYRFIPFRGPLILVPESFMPSYRLRDESDDYRRQHHEEFLEELAKDLVHEGTHAQRFYHKNDPIGVRGNFQYGFNILGEEKIAYEASGWDWNVYKKYYTGFYSIGGALIKPILMPALIGLGLGAWAYSATKRKIQGKSNPNLNSQTRFNR